MVKALLALLVTFHLVDAQSQTYAILSFFADGTFAFLPMLLAYTTAKKMKCNVIPWARRPSCSTAAGAPWWPRARP